MRPSLARILAGAHDSPETIIHSLATAILNGRKEECLDQLRKEQREVIGRLRVQIGRR